MTELARVTAQPRGARFYRADLHIHTHGALHDVQDAAMTPQAVVETALAEGLGLIAIADHNDITNVAAAVAAAHGADLLVVPAVELSTPQGHLLCYTPTPTALNRFMAQLGLAEPGTPNSRCQNAMLDCLDKLQAVGGFAVLAHVDAPSGFDVQTPGMSPHKVDVLCHPALLGIELKSASSDIRYGEDGPDAARVDAGKTRVTRLGLTAKQVLARVPNSDSHTLAALGRNAQGDRRVTRVKMATPSFDALRQALQDPDARVRLEDNIPTAIPHILGATFEGGFLSDQVVHFSQNLNCIIGGRGTGKSTLFEAVRCLAGGESSSAALDSEIWPVGLHLFWQDAAGQQHCLFRPLGGDLDNVGDPFDGPVTFAIDSFGQSETAKISQQAQSDPVALLGYLDRFVDLGADLATEVEARGALLDLQTKIETAQSKVDLIPQYERLLSVAKQQLAALQKANAKDIIELQRKVSEERAVRERVSGKLTELQNDLSAASPKTRIEQLRQIADPAPPAARCGGVSIHPQRRHCL
jgi:AAA domain